ncbi:hypothetical protein CWB96_11875 [Pseudoalteromonas citrea]|uniref:Lysozyme n=1 Tax=Pseudoalteromonas citrea TaxID=43655 RepID=A0A5S3XNI6_9GAMM|nr:hypothetical protein [Pseudoalteromonas citrea]TMP43874.1 hypothetical protein CWB97_07615 [Pseudoalteromonas citrea]TMP58567.1 hypothetical protein CWB96_11875 [Pseudoalteromonas citrea]
MAPKNSDFIATLKQFEGQINHLYLDSRGNPTIGIGFMMANVDQFCALLMHTKQHQPATNKQKRDEYLRLSQLPSGYKAQWYKAHCQLYLPEQQCDIVLHHHLGQFERELAVIFNRKNGFKQEFHSLPNPVKSALLDMVFNLGSHHLANHWPKLHHAIKQQDWQRAAKECHRKHIQTERNKQTAQWFKSAASDTRSYSWVKWLVRKILNRK